ncbi:MAG: class I SAM-dependent methyltransferase [Pseudomonadota bacterium]
MVDDEKFWNRTAKKYAKSPIKNMEAYLQTMDRVKAHLSKEDQVLELGCGTGSTALLLADSADRITGSDISSAMIDIAKSKAKDQEVGNVDFLRWTVSDGKLEREPFDAVMAFNFLHLVEDTAGAVRRVTELLKPGGVFISKTLCLAEKTKLLRVLVYVMQKVGYAPYVKFFGIGDLEQSITKAGFEIIETGMYPAPSRFIVARRI